ncbi:hypothetical protein E2C01_098102 [Portunus trituberculatus]|uniref:Uncharacterized protein n=1 Tax=Portunus trituberculatus TaxID=210409 RepID=A0A5B7K244_PORTR|nr:hypothetical protein [Portunus trituberculatus]
MTRFHIHSGDYLAISWLRIPFSFLYSVFYWVVCPLTSPSKLMWGFK